MGHFSLLLFLIALALFSRMLEIQEVESLFYSFQMQIWEV